jgi:hypothetical protein
VTIYSYEEDGTVTVNVSPQFNLCLFGRNVFGVPVADLEECNLPGPDEPVGAILTRPGEVDAYIEAIRPVVARRRSGRRPGRTGR